MIIQPSDDIRYTDMTELPASQRRRLNGSDFDVIKDAWDIVYIPPVDTTMTLAEYKASRLGEVRQDSNLYIEATYPLWYQSNVALGIYAEGNMVTDIAAVIEESNRVENAVDAAVDIAGVDAAYATLSWPVIGA